MNRRDMIAFEQHIASTYRREASARKAKNPVLAAQLTRWAEASESRVSAIKNGPLFEEAER